MLTRLFAAEYGAGTAAEQERRIAAAPVMSVEESLKHPYFASRDMIRTVPDPILGERMCACVILRQGRSLTLEELIGFLAEQEFAKHKLPERLEIMEDFPLSPFGKVSKKDLTERIALKLREEGKL